MCDVVGDRPLGENEPLGDLGVAEPLGDQARDLGILAGGYALLGEEERAREWIDRALLGSAPSSSPDASGFSDVLISNNADLLGTSSGAVLA